MDGGLPATWIVAMTCVVVAAVGVAAVVSVGAYKIGKLAGKLEKMEGDHQKVGGGAGVDTTLAGPSTGASNSAKDGTAVGVKKKKTRKEEEEESGESNGEEESESSSDNDEVGESGSESEAETTKESKRKVGKDGEKTGTKEVTTTKKKKTKKVKDDNWEWPVYDTWWSDITYRMERKLRAAPKKEKANFAPFEVTYEQRKGWPDEVTVKLRSKPLIEVAKRILLKHSEELILDEPQIDGQIMFVALDPFKEVFQSMPEDNKSSLGRCHLKHLIRFLETEYKDTAVRVARMRRERKVTWELLWAFLHKDEEVYYTCAKTGQTLKGIVSYSCYVESMQGKLLLVHLKACDYNGRKYVNCSVPIEVDEFRREKSFEAIGICPLRLLEDEEVARLEEMFLRNGRKFYHIVSQGSCYVQYEGPRLRMVQVNSCWQLKKQKADGRVMADLLSFARMNPDYPLENAEPPTSCKTPGGMVCDGEVPSDDDLKLAPAVVYGFSFSNKQWGGFDVNGFSEIEFDDQAFDRDLVLSDPSRKQMILALVSEFLCGGDGDGELEGVEKMDPITNKGDGCIFLCYGPPGTGKTLTAESMAEKLHRPLWAISVFELGTNAKELETNLIEILDIASQWRAVLLLDEADIYMEKRTSRGDPKRTAMTAIFLRVLEYYRGVLFLTTNRVASFDDAFCSRISMFLRYHRLAGAQREAVWRNLFAKAGIADPDLGPFLQTQLNGREIRNTIRIAQTWAKSSGASLTPGHVLEVVNMLGEFRQDLEGAIRDESEDSSISRALEKVRSMKVTGGDAGLNGTFVKVTASTDDEDNTAT